MGSDAKQLRNRIKSVDSTMHLTRAMGLVASSKIRRATEAMTKSRRYAEAFTQAMDILASSGECKKSPYLEQRDTGRTRLIVIAGDRGLAGGYNANVFRFLRDYPDAELIPIGKKACDKYHGEFYSAEHFTPDEASGMAKKLCDDFASGEYDRLGIVYTGYVSVMTQETRVKWVLPLERKPGVKSTGMIFEPDEMTVLNYAVSEYVTGILVAAVRESFASEVAARRCAMDAADKNAQVMIDELSLAYNRARQGAITQELIEIVAGSGS
ncbi:MAG: ATP synthase F1 subunit gamma [Clostridia bacterium]|nr:ATP synthase F1 subunit gamma [Clostridia bacterium]